MCCCIAMSSGITCWTVTMLGVERVEDVEDEKPSAAFTSGACPSPRMAARSITARVREYCPAIDSREEFNVDWRRHRLGRTESIRCSLSEVLGAVESRRDDLAAAATVSETRQSDTQRSSRNVADWTMPARSRCVAAITRTSTRRGSPPPTLSMKESLRTRRNRTCAFQRQFANLIKEKRPAVGSFEPAASQLQKRG